MDDDEEGVRHAVVNLVLLHIAWGHWWGVCLFGKYGLACNVDAYLVYLPAHLFTDIIGIALHSRQDQVAVFLFWFFFGGTTQGTQEFI